MNLASPAASIFVPDGRPLGEACARITHLGVGAHPDDVEIVAAAGIAETFGARGFAGVVCADGAGSPRAGDFAAVGDEDMKHLRAQEQQQAARAGGYGLLIQLGLPSARVKTQADPALRDDLARIFLAVAPKIVYTHNLVDRHDTHLAVALACIQALRLLPRQARPQRLWGCEVWRSLDWLSAGDRVRLPVPAPGIEAVGRALAAHESQIAGGKRYDRATAGRRQANATYDDPQQTDGWDELVLAMDLTPLILDDQADIAAFVTRLIEEFRAEAMAALRRRLEV